MCNLGQGVFEDGLQRGRMQGRQEGRMEGRVEGRKEGRAEGKDHSFRGISLLKKTMARADRYKEFEAALDDPGQLDRLFSEFDIENQLG